MKRYITVVLEGKLEDTPVKRISFVFPYTSRTKNSKLIFYANEAVRESYNLRTAPGVTFELLYKGKHYPLHKNASLTRLINYLPDEELSFYFKSGIGEAFDKINGIKYFVHSNERGITPHLHARYQGEEISIDLITFDLTGSLNNIKKEKEALRFAKSNHKALIEFYNANSNGINISYEEAVSMVK